MSGIKLPSIERPTGGKYQPRKISHVTLGNEDEITGIAILGTHDIQYATIYAQDVLKGIAHEFYGEWITLPLASQGELVWYRRDLAGWDEDRPIYSYCSDPTKGRAGVMFDVNEVEADR